MPDIFRGQLPREHAATQRENFEVHDPLPSEDIGPFTDTRPRSYNIQRAVPRRAKDNYFAPGLERAPQSGIAPRGTSSTAEFPNSVESP